MQNNLSQPLIQVKPEFNILKQTLFILIQALFGGIATGLFYGYIGLYFFKEYITPYFPGHSIVFIIFLAVTLSIFTIRFILRYQTYQKKEYFIYSDRIEYTDGFLVSESKTILLQNIIACNHSINIIQKLFLDNIGSVSLIIPSIELSSQNNVSSNQFVLKDLRDSLEVYNTLQNLINK